jgi:hypothetical protein
MDAGSVVIDAFVGPKSTYSLAPSYVSYGAGYMNYISPSVEVKQKGICVMMHDVGLPAMIQAPSLYVR